MAIDISFPPEVAEVRLLVRKFVTTVINPAEEELRSQPTRTGRRPAGANGDRRATAQMIVKLRQQARDHHLWLPHMPAEWGGMDLGPTAVAAAFAEASRSPLGPYVLNCQAPDDGVHLALLNWGSPQQQDRYLKPLCDGVARACVADTEPQHSASYPSPPATVAIKDGDEWVLTGQKWFVMGARGAQVALVLAQTDENGEKSEDHSVFIVDLPNSGWEVVREIETISGTHNQCEVQIKDLRLPAESLLGGPGQGHQVLGTRSVPSRLADCMRWIALCEAALEMMIERELAEAESDLPSRGRRMIAEATQELYQAKLMVLHTANRLETRQPPEVQLSMARLHLASSLQRTVERAIDMHGLLGHSTDTPLAEMLKQARAARVVDGLDDDHLALIADQAIVDYRERASTRRVTGDLPL